MDRRGGTFVLRGDGAADGGGEALIAATSYPCSSERIGVLAHAVIPNDSVVSASSLSRVSIYMLILRRLPKRNSYEFESSMNLDHISNEYSSVAEQLSHYVVLFYPYCPYG